MTAQQINTILFWTTLSIVALSVWLMLSAKKFGEQLDKNEKAAKSAKKLKTSKRKAAK